MLVPLSTLDPLADLGKVPETEAALVDFAGLGLGGGGAGAGVAGAIGATSPV